MAMIILVSVAFVLTCSCVNAGIIQDLVDEITAKKGGFTRGTGREQTDILIMAGKGIFVLEMAPYISETSTLMYVRLYWKTTEKKLYELQLLQVAWPKGQTPSIALVRDSIDAEIGNNGQLIVKYFKSHICTTKVYRWNGAKYQDGTPTNKALNNCLTR